MPILLGALASLFIGISDTFGRVSSRRADSVSHVATQMLVGLFVAAGVALAIGSDVIAVDVVAGTMSGVAIALALAVVYRGMAESSSAVVAPTAAVLAGVGPLLWDLAGGASLSGLEAIGCVVAFVSLVLTTFNPDLGDRVRSGLILAVIGGVLFGVAIVLAADTSEASGAWPAAAQRSSGFLAMALLARSRRVPVLLPAGVRRFGVAGGVAGAAGMVCWVLGAQQGDLGTVSVISSTYPAVVALLTAVFDEDQVRWWQGLGIVGSIVGGAMIAI